MPAAPNGILQRIDVWNGTPIPDPSSPPYLAYALDGPDKGFWVNVVTGAVPPALPQKIRIKFTASADLLPTERFVVGRNNYGGGLLGAENPTATYDTIAAAVAAVIATRPGLPSAIQVHEDTYVEDVTLPEHCSLVGLGSAEGVIIQGTVSYTGFPDVLLSNFLCNTLNLHPVAPDNSKGVVVNNVRVLGNATTTNTAGKYATVYLNESRVDGILGVTADPGNSSFCTVRAQQCRLNEVLCTGPGFVIAFNSSIYGQVTFTNTSQQLAIGGFFGCDMYCTIPKAIFKLGDIGANQFGVICSALECFYNPAPGSPGVVIAQIGPNAGFNLQHGQLSTQPPPGRFVVEALGPVGGLLSLHDLLELRFDPSFRASPQVDPLVQASLGPFILDERGVSQVDVSATAPNPTVVDLEGLGVSAVIELNPQYGAPVAPGGPYALAQMPDASKLPTGQTVTMVNTTDPTANTPVALTPAPGQTLARYTPNTAYPVTPATNFILAGDGFATFYVNSARNGWIQCG